MFQLSSHCCLVMNHMRSTLLEFICRPIVATDSDKTNTDESNGVTGLSLSGMNGKQSIDVTRPR